ncbi:glycosyltransferase family 1 protein [Cyanobium sp. To12R1]|nr:glycosyltransferase family 1 protein [Cyanobium sp. To12R1]
MRSVEVGAIGSCILAEDTPDHRAIYGDAAAFFDTPAAMVQQAHALVANAARREAMAASVREQIRSSGHTYKDRLRTILSAA